MRIRLVKLLPLCIAASFMCACGEPSVAKAPELLEPKANEIVYEEVCRRDVGAYANSKDKQNYVAVCVPNEHCQFFTKNVMIDDLKVAVGDYVKKGDVIATVDTEDIRRHIKELQDEIEYKEGLYALEENKFAYDYAAKKCDYDLTLQNMWESHEERTQKQTDSVNGALGEFEENRINDIRLHEFNIRYLNNEIARYNKQLENTTLTASCDGVVTYIKDMNVTRDTNGEENVAIISDFDDLHFEVSGVTCDSKLFEQADDCYCYIDGEKYKVTEDAYSPVETRVMQSKKKYANVRVNIENCPKQFKAGDALQITFRRNYAQDVLSVMKDSVYSDKNGSFVYVKTPSGDEIRRVEIGNTDKYYTQIISGLSEGEMVKREVNPLDKNEKFIKAGIREVPISGWKKRDYSEKKYFAKDDGIVSEVVTPEKSQIEKGETALTVRRMGVRSEVVDLENGIEQIAVDLASQNQAIDEDIAEYQKRLDKDIIPSVQEACEAMGNIAKLTGLIEDEEKVSGSLYEMWRRLQETKDMYDAMIASKNLEKQINVYKSQYEESVFRNKLEKASENMNAQGSINICADESGYVGRMSVKQGTSLNVNDPMFTLYIPCDDCIIIFTDEDMALGQTVVFRKDMVEYVGTIYGMISAPAPRYHTTVRDDSVYLTADTAASSQNSYYVSLASTDLYEKVNRDYSCLANVYKVEEEIDLSKLNKSRKTLRK